ncbi:MAG: hypothetical protein ACC651_08580 [Candidatus Scalindua sp.]
MRETDGLLIDSPQRRKTRKEKIELKKSNDPEWNLLMKNVSVIN